MRRFMRGSWVLGWIGALACLSGGVSRLSAEDTAAAPSASYEAEKAKALANPYPNDFGPTLIDASKYPAEIQATYKTLLTVKCARCHQASRPLNSQFLEPYGTKAEKAAKLVEWKQKNPEIFKDRAVWQPEANIWERYVKRMMAKPGCNIQPAEGRKIWQFLTYDSEQRKTGANAAGWEKQRRQLLADFKAKHPARYNELFETR